MSNHRHSRMHYRSLAGSSSTRYIDMTAAAVLLETARLFCKGGCRVQVMTSRSGIRISLSMQCNNSSNCVVMKDIHTLIQTIKSSCMNKSWIGTQKLNLVIQAMFWDRARPYLELPRYKIAGKDQPAIRVQVGSKVVYTANTYDFDG